MNSIIFNAICARVLRDYLRGQFITLYSLQRWSIAQDVCLGNKTTLIILCGGTSGSGKSTLAALIASQLHIPTILSTDTIRQVLRTQYEPQKKKKKKEISSNNNNNNNNICSVDVNVTREDEMRDKIYNILQSSSYDPLHGESTSEDTYEKPNNDNNNNKINNIRDEEDDILVKERVQNHYFAQCSYILPVLDRIIAKNVMAGRSMVLEGVHLHPAYMAQKQYEVNMNCTNHGVCVAILLQIAKEERHRQRFAIRAKSMSLSPQVNRYVAKFNNIRTIQELLEREAETVNTNCKEEYEEKEKEIEVATNKIYYSHEYKGLHHNRVITVNNTSTDKSWMILHCKILSILESYELTREKVNKMKSEITNKNRECISDEKKSLVVNEPELEQETDNHNYDSSNNNNNNKQKCEDINYMYYNLSSKKALKLLHERKENKRKKINKSLSIELKWTESKSKKYENKHDLNNCKHSNTKCNNINYTDNSDVIDARMNETYATYNTGVANRTVSVPAHITFCKST